MVFNGDFVSSGRIRLSDGGDSAPSYGFGGTGAGGQTTGLSFGTFDGRPSIMFGANSAGVAVLHDLAFRPRTNNLIDIGNLGTSWRTFYASTSYNVGTGEASSTLSPGNLTLSATGTFAGGVVVTNVNNIGWSVVNAANQACNTTCTNACVVGLDTAAVGNFLACTDATADTCLCAGGS